MKKIIMILFVMLMVCGATFATSAEDPPLDVPDITISENLVLSADAEYNNVTITSGTVKLNGYTLKVYGDLDIIGGSIDLAGGRVEVGGSCSMGAASRLYMRDASDYMLVNGDFTFTGHSYYSGTSFMEAGTLEVKGDFTDGTDISTSFKASGEHKVLLSGKEKQTVSLGYSDSGFAYLDINNPNVILNGKINIYKLADDATILSASGYINADLNGNALTVKGSFNNDGGAVRVNNGTFKVNGDLTQVGGSIELAGGRVEVGGSCSMGAASRLYMRDASDYMLVNGDFTFTGHSYYSGTSFMEAGTLEVKGDFTDGNDISTFFRASREHKVLLSGKEKQTVSLGYSDSGFAYLDINNPNVILNGKINIYKLADDATILSASGYINADLNGNALTVKGDFNNNGGAVRVNNGTLKVKGNLTQIGGNIDLSGGRVEVGGSCSMGAASRLYMRDASDYMLVNGDFTFTGHSYYSGTSFMEAGTLEVKGDFTDGNDISTSFRASREHKVLLSGKEKQTVSLGYSDSGFAYLDINNPNVILNGKINIYKLADDATILSASGYINVDLNGNALTVKGDFNNNGGAVRVNNGTFKVNGDLTQVGGRIELGGGRVEVGGSCSMGAASRLYMRDASDYMLVNGDFTFTGYSIYSGTSFMEAGTLEIKGDFTDGNDISTSFRASREHKVLLSGKEVQSVTLNSQYSSFYTLVLANDLSQYNFVNLRYNNIEYAYASAEYPDPVFSNLTTFDSKTQCAFYVYSRYDASPSIAGASVTFNGVTKKTDAYGLVVFDKPSSSMASITAKKYGYNEYSQDDYVLNSDSGCNYISMTPLDAKSYLESVLCNGRDVLTSTVRLDCSAKEPITVKVKAKSEYPITGYAIIQGGNILAVSKDGTFTLNCGDFTAKEQVSIRVENAGRTVVTYGININVYDSKAQNRLPIIDNITIGGKSKITIDSDIPVIGGMEIGVKEKDLPIFLCVSDDKVKIGINLKVDEYTTYTKEKIINKLVKGGTETEEKVKLKFAGYLELVFDENGDMVKTKGIAYMSVTLKGEKDFYTAIGMVPVTLGVEAELSGALNIELLGYDFEKATFIFPNVNMTLEGLLTLRGGVGVKYLNAGVYGSIDNELTGSLFPTFEFQKWLISGELGVYGKVGIFEAKLPLLKTGKLQVYPFTGADRSLIEYATFSDERFYSAAQYSLVAVTAELSNIVQNYAIENGFVLDHDAYAYTEPSVVRCDDKTVMVYLDHITDGRSAANSQVLMYRVYDEPANTWSEARQLDNNKTADSEFELYCDGKDIYLIYTEAKEILSDDVDVYSYPAMIEVVVSVYDTEKHEFGTPIRITDNDVYETMPCIISHDGDLSALWVQNSENAIFCDNSSNDILISRCIDGVWETPRTLLSGLDTLTDIEIADVKGDVCVAYTSDDDHDLSTQEDKRIMLFYDADKSVVTVSENGFYSELSFEDVLGRKCLVYCSDNDLFYSFADDDKPMSVEFFDRAVVGLDNYKIVSDEEGRAAVLFLKNGDSCRELWGIYGNVNTFKWGAPMKIIDGRDYINAFDADFEDGVLTVAYLSASVSSIDDSYETNCSLIWELVESKEDIEVTGVSVDYLTISPKKKASVDVSVRNNGFSRIEGVTLSLMDVNGNIIAEKIFTNSIGSGEELTVVFDFVCPERIDTSAYKLAVRTESITDGDDTNDFVELDIWKSDLSLSVQQIVVGTDNYISATLINNGYLPTNGVLNLLGENGSTIASKPIKVLDHGQVEEIRIKISEEHLGVSDTGLFFLSVDAMSDDYDLGNNESTVYLADIEVGNGIIISQEYASIHYGDATGDGIIDGKDLVRLKKYLAEFDFDTGISSVEINDGADVTGDGVVDSKDIVRLKKYLTRYDYDTGTSDVILGPVA